MFECKIKLRPEEVKEFVAAATKCDFDIDVTYNRVVIDAKSILWVLGLDLSRALTVRCFGYDTDFAQYLKAFALAC